MQDQAQASQVDLYCPECEYDLSALTSDRCPWCGWPVDVQELVNANLSRKSRMRLGVAGAAIVVGLCVFAALSALYSHSRQLGWRDALAVLSVFIVAVGHLGLGAMSLWSHHWPMRAGEISNLLRVIGWGSIAAGAVAATPIWYAAPNPLVVKGVQVNGVLEFFLTAFFYSIPGVMLLILRVVSFRRPAAPSASVQGGAASEAAPFVVEVGRRYPLDQVSQAWSDMPRRSDPRIEEMIARTWEAETSIAQEEGRRLYNGRVGRLVGLEAADTSLRLTIGETNYREFLGTNLFHAAEVTRIDAAFRADALGTSALVLTSDGFAVLGLRSRNVAYHAGWLHTLGGLLEEADWTAQGYDLRASMYRELKEEVGVEAAEISDMALTGLVRDRAISQPELLFDVAVRMTRGQIRARFEARNDAEHTDLVFVPDDPQGAAEFLRNRQKVTPVAQAALLLHGKHTWRSQWYEQTCLFLYGNVPKAR